MLIINDIVWENWRKFLNFISSTNTYEMSKKAPPEILSPSDLAYMSTLNERDKRWFLATKAANLKAQGFSYRKVGKRMGISTHTLQKVSGNFLREKVLVMAASAERELDARVCFPSILNGHRLSCKSSNRTQRVSRRMRMWYGYP